MVWNKKEDFLCYLSLQSFLDSLFPKRIQVRYHYTYKITLPYCFPCPGTNPFAFEWKHDMLFNYLLPISSLILCFKSPFPKSSILALCSIIFVPIYAMFVLKNISISWLNFIKSNFPSLFLPGQIISTSSHSEEISGQYTFFQCQLSLSNNVLVVD